VEPPVMILSTPQPTGRAISCAGLARKARHDQQVRLA